MAEILPALRPRAHTAAADIGDDVEGVGVTGRQTQSLAGNKLGIGVAAACGVFNVARGSVGITIVVCLFPVLNTKSIVCEPSSAASEPPQWPAPPAI